MEPETQRLVNLLKMTLRLVGLSHREVARRMGMSPSYLSKLFSGASDIRLEHVVRICQAANLEPAEFFSMAYPPKAARSSVATSRLRELLQPIESLPPPSSPAPALDEAQLEANLQAMLEKLLERRTGTR